MLELALAVVVEPVEAVVLVVQDFEAVAFAVQATRVVEPFVFGFSSV